MPVTYEDINIESAQEYYLVPIKDQESMFYLGNKNKLNALKIVMEASLVVSTGGVASKDPENEEGTKCYIMINTDKAGCEQIIADVNSVVGRTFKLNNNVE